MDKKTIIVSSVLLAVAALINYLFPFIFGVAAYIILTILSMIAYFISNQGLGYQNGVLPISPSLVAYGSILLLLLSVIINNPTLAQIMTAISGLVLISTALIVDYSNYQSAPGWWSKVSETSYWIGGTLVVVAILWNVAIAIQGHESTQDWIDTKTDQTITKEKDTVQSSEEANDLEGIDSTDRTWCFQWKQSGTSSSRLYPAEIETLTSDQLAFSYISEADKKVIIRTEKQSWLNKALYSGQIVGTDSQVELRKKNDSYFTGTSTTNSTTYDLTLYATDGTCK